jgi:hypothetical protein
MGSDSYEGRGSLSSLGHSAYPQWKACRKTNPTHYDCGKYKGSEIRGCIQHMTGVLPESVKALMNDSGGELSRLFSSSKRLLGTLKRLLSEISSSLSSIIGVLTSGATTVTLTAAVAAGTVLAATGVGIPVAVAALGLLELRDKATDGLRAARTGVNSAVSMVIQSVAQHAEAKNQWLHGSWRAPVIVAIDEIIAIGEAAQTPWTLPSTKTACSAIYPRISISCLDTLIPSTCVIPIVSVAGITKRIDPSDIFLPRTPGLFDSEGGGGALTIEGFGGIKESRVWGLKPWQAILLGAGVFLFLSNKRDG